MIGIDRIFRMYRLITFVTSWAALLPSVALTQTTLRVQRDIAYAEPKNERQLLDGYAPQSALNRVGAEGTEFRPGVECMAKTLTSKRGALTTVLSQWPRGKPNRSERPNLAPSRA